MSARLRLMAFLVVGVVAAIGIGAGGASSAVVPKVTLTLVVKGNGGVVSKPAGISCPTACKLKVKKGAHVVLTAQPDEGSQLGSWSVACGTRLTCTVTMTKSKTVTVAFKTPPPPPPTTTTPPPPPPAKPGHYHGAYSDGEGFDLDVDSSGTRALNVVFESNGSCNGPYYLSTGNSHVPGPTPIQADGSFIGTFTYTYSNGDVETTNVAGKFASDGSATGTANDKYTFSPSGPDAGLVCTSTGTWTAKLQS